MAEGTEGGEAPLKHTREVAIAALMEHFANDVMDVDEFERRVGAAHAATTSNELKALLHDLPASVNLPAVSGHQTTPTSMPGYHVTAASHMKDSAVIVGVLSGASRRGRWRPARKNTCITIMGGAEIDFRGAVFGPGVTELRIFSLWGGTEVIVPPGINVEANGVVALMGAFEHETDESAVHDPTTPTLRVTGVVCMGGVEVTTRHAGESARDARRRRKQLRREQRRRLRSG